LTSEVFHKALANLRRFEWRGVPFAAWLLRIAANAIADRAGRVGKELAVEDPPELAADATADVDLEEGERRARLYRLVDELPADQRRVIALRFAEEKSICEIVKQLQFRGLENLREKIKGGKRLRTRRSAKESGKPGGTRA
jgi:RNA polymerase sigma-70 factor (ECF subfamily)